MRIFCLTIIVFLCSVAAGQRIEGMNVFDAGSSVVIKFTVLPGSSCAGFVVLHSLDSMNYTEIGSDPAICGETSAPEDKSYTHASPVAGRVNYYKIRLEPRVETSVARSIYDLTEGDKTTATLYPNPITTSNIPLTLKAFNTENTEFKTYIYNQFGMTIREMNTRFSQNEAQVPIADLENGLYFIRVSSGTKTFFFRFIILR
jgi:hypothetical protein